MHLDSLMFQLVAIMIGAGVLGTLFLYVRQPILLAYIAVGILIGPSGLQLISESKNVEDIGHLGVVLLLFILGLNLQPKKLLGLFKKTALVTLGTSLVFAATALVFARLIGLNWVESCVFGAALMFSSTVISLKLIPTTTLHQRHAGEMMTSVLLLQDILAILVILFISGDGGQTAYVAFAFLLAKFALVTVAAFAGFRLVLFKLFLKFDVIQEYTFVATLAWCLLWAAVSQWLGLSYEIGAFVAGLSIASSRVALAISEHLKPLREFFLILFFFSVGAKFDLNLDPYLLAWGAAFGVVILLVKIFVFRQCFIWAGERVPIANELGFRLGQGSEFSILVAFAALYAGLISEQAAMVLQTTTLVTFVLSTYWVVRRFPTPISGGALRRD